MKILLVGESGVGKSCLLLRFVDDCFSDTFISTIGVDFKYKRVDVDVNGVEKVAKLQIWDTAGQDKFRCITRNYYRGAAGIFLCFDTTNASSFARVTSWVDDIKKYTTQDTVVIMVGTKTDLVDEREVDMHEAEQLAKQLGVPYFETSSKDNAGVYNAFLTLTRQVIDKKIELHRNEMKTVDIKQTPKKHREGCGCIIV
jgi:Ras-related protein Rab-1A